MPDDLGGSKLDEKIEGDQNRRHTDRGSRVGGALLTMLGISTDLLVQLGLVSFFVVLTIAYLRRRLYKCPECYHRSDYDHIAEVTEERPYCPYCGTKTEFIGRKYQAWLYRLGVDSEYRVITADDNGGESDV